jgi:integrase
VEETLLRPVVAFFGASRVLRTITDADFREYQAYRRRCLHPKTKRPIGTRSINYELYCLRKILEQANLWNETFHKKYRPLRVTKETVGKALQPEAAATLFAVAKQEDGWLVAFLASLVAYATGCRSWEIKTLTLERIDLDANELTVRAKYAKNRKQRDVALNSISRWAVERLLERARLLGATRPEHFLLPFNRSKCTTGDPTNRGTGFDPTKHQRSWASAWRSLRKKAGMPGFRFHDLRHTYNTQGAERGVPLDVLMAQVGHLDEEMRRHYTHISNRAKHSLAASIEAANGAVLDVLGIASNSHAAD